MKNIRVYIASPYTNGDREENVRFQMKVSNELLDLGFYPFTPLYMHFQHLIYPRTPESWLSLDFVWLRQCDCIIRFFTEYNNVVLHSPGADMEENLAREIGIPIFYSVSEMVDYYKEKGDN
jgi:hypothetical protein